MTRTPEPAWVARTLHAINAMPNTSDDDKARIRMAKTIIRSAEIDDPKFPTPIVFMDSSGAICIEWRDVEVKPDGPATLEIRVSRGTSFRGLISRPGNVAEVSVVTEDFAEGSRRLIGKFWPGSSPWRASDLMELTEVKR